MKNTIISLIFFVLFFDLNILAQSETNQINVLASKPEVSEKTKNFNNHLNIALMSYHEVKELVQYAIDNYNDKQLWHLAYEIMTSQYYEFHPMLIKARIKHAKTPTDKAGLQCSYVQSAFLVKWRKSNYNKNDDMQINQKLRDAIYDAVNNFPSDCQDQKNILFLIAANQCAMTVAYEHENDLDKAWGFYKNGRTKIGDPPYENITEKNVDLNNYLDWTLQGLAVSLIENKNLINKKTSLKTIQELKKAVKKLPDSDFEKGQKLECLNILKQYEKEIAEASVKNKTK